MEKGKVILNLHLGIIASIGWASYKLGRYKSIIKDSNREFKSKKEIEYIFKKNGC